MTIQDIEDIIKESKQHMFFTVKNDVTFSLLQPIVGSEAAAYLAFQSMPKNLPKYAGGTKVKYLRKKLSEMTKSSDDTELGDEQAPIEYTKEENLRRMLRELDDINMKERNGDFDAERASLARVKIYSELNKNFDMDKSQDERRLIVVVKKHDIVCPITHRECTYMPTKEACMKYYNLKEDKANDKK